MQLSAPRGGPGVPELAALQMLPGGPGYAPIPGPGGYPGQLPRLLGPAPAGARGPGTAGVRARVATPGVVKRQFSSEEVRASMRELAKREAELAAATEQLRATVEDVSRPSPLPERREALSASAPLVKDSSDPSPLENGDGPRIDGNDGSPPHTPGDDDALNQSELSEMDTGRGPHTAPRSAKLGSVDDDDDDRRALELDALPGDLS